MKGVPAMFFFRKHSKVQDKLLEFENVVGVGKGIKQIRGKNAGKMSTVVLVKEKIPLKQLYRDQIIPKNIDGEVTDVIEVGDLQLLGRTDLARPAQPGMSIGHYKITAGTFGAVVKDKTTGEPFILSNNHVLANITDGTDERSKIGDPILQPGRYDGGTDKDVIAYLERFVPLHKTIGFPSCQIASGFAWCLNMAISLFKPQYQITVLRKTGKTNAVDAALARPVNPADISNEVFDLGPIKGIKRAESGMVVQKSGRTTGVTQNKIKVMEATLKISLGGSEIGVFEDQLVAGPMSEPGDSGSLILSEDNYAIGLLFAGSDKATVINRIETVFEQLNVTF
jgi:hypothetical protein